LNTCFQLNWVKNDNTRKIWGSLLDLTLILLLYLYVVSPYKAGRSVQYKGKIYVVTVQEKTVQVYAESCCGP